MINEDKFAISATVTCPYSEFIVPQAEPELSDKQATLPFNLGIFDTAMSRHSSKVSRTKLLLLMSAFLIAL